MEKSKVMGHIFAIITILVWGSCFVLTKNLLVYFTPIQIIPLRMGLAYITLWVLRPKTLRLPWKDELMFILIGITGGSFYFFLQNTALDHTYAANVSILVALSPILTVLLAQLFSRSNERLGKYVYIGAVIAIAGVVLVVLNGQMSFHLSPVGDLLALAAALMWAVYSVLIKKYTEQYDNFIVTRRVFLWAFLTAVPLMLLTDGMPDLTPLFTVPKVLISWLFLGVMGNAVCFAIWNIAFKSLGVVVTNNYLYASPFVTVFVGWLLLDEPGWRDLACDYSLFIGADEDRLRPRLIRRKIQGGLSRSAAEAFYEACDGPNIRRCMARRRRADVNLRMTGDGSFEIAPPGMG